MRYNDVRVCGYQTCSGAIRTRGGLSGYDWRKNIGTPEAGIGRQQLYSCHLRFRDDGEGGILGLKQEGRAYEIEQKYSESPEELFHISCLSRRPERFYEFYREEILKKIPDMTPSVRALARLEEENKLQCIVTTNIFDLPEQVGCRNVIYLHGSIYKNRCPHCGRLYSMEEIRDSRPCSPL